MDFVLLCRDRKNLLHFEVEQTALNSANCVKAIKQESKGRFSVWISEYFSIMSPLWH